MWYPSLGRDGYGEPRRFPRDEIDDNLPGPMFYANPWGVALMAAMTGDGLPDLVQITASQVRYWPGLGHGKLGKMVVMSHCPTLGAPGELDGRRVRLADLDGSGTADLLYFDESGAVYDGGDSGCVQWGQRSGL